MTMITKERWKEITKAILKTMKDSMELDLPDNINEYLNTLSKEELDELEISKEELEEFNPYEE